MKFKKIVNLTITISILTQLILTHQILTESNAISQKNTNNNLTGYALTNKLQKALNKTNLFVQNNKKNITAITATGIIAIISFVAINKYKSSNKNLPPLSKFEHLK
ncbi:MAG: hypothetical protein ACD_82C00094G0001, partial [uncultured bacterium]